MRKLSLLIVIALGSLIALTTTVQAADAAAPGGRGGRGVQQRLDQFKAFLKDTKLTDKQEADLKKCLEDQTKAMAEIRAKTDLSQEDRRAEQKKLTEKTTAAIEKAIGKELCTKWEAFVKENPQRGGRRAQQQQ